MFNVFISFLVSSLHLNSNETLSVNVVIPTEEIEGIYLPAGYTGPIVAAPLDDQIFSQN